MTEQIHNILPFMVDEKTFNGWETIAGFLTEYQARAYAVMIAKGRTDLVRIRMIGARCV